MTTLRVEQNAAHDVGSCACCGNNSRAVSGFIYSGEQPTAAYFVHWTLGRPDHGANFDLVLGKWGEGVGREDRYAVSLCYRPTEKGPEFMVIDSSGRTVAGSELVGRALRRDEVIGTPMATEVFAIIDAIYLGDARLAELRAS
jgi:hypothetical protein